MRVRPIFTLALILGSCLLWPAGAIAQPADHESTLRARQEIRTRLGKLLSKRQALADRLESLMQSLDKIQAELDEQSARLARDQAREEQLLAALDRTTIELLTLNPQVNVLEAVFARRMRALYLFGAEASYSLLGQADDFRQYLVRSQYLTWTARSDLDLLKDLKSRRSRLTDLRVQMADEREELVALRQILERRQASLSKVMRERQDLLERLQTEQMECDQAIAAVNEAQSRLVRTFALGPLIPPELTDAGTAIEERASPPVEEGKVLGRGGPLERGVVMSARPGSRVRSPWSGRVAFADALNGYGRVVVLDHGERIHTVLAHLGKLSVESAQNVSAGQVVGAVGPGGRLYLEVRLGALTVDPFTWLGLNP
jgi:septal ring factor EnvC (AmiA/AmiB activator)